MDTKTTTAGADTRLWRTYLTAKDRCIFSTYVHVDADKHHRNEFRYVNPTNKRQRIVALILDASGHLPMGMNEPTVFFLDPGAVMRIDVTSVLAPFGIRRFNGSFQAIVSNEDETEVDNRHMHHMATWLSNEGAVQILTAGHKHINVNGKKEGKRFVMFCSAVYDTEDIQTRITIFNHATEADYADRVTIRPILHNADGTSLEGKAVTIEPFGSFDLNVDEWFGVEGRHLLAATAGRGSLHIYHQGQTLATLFFHVDKKTGALLSGQHTQPVVPALFFNPTYNYWVEWIGQHVPFMSSCIPAVSYMKHHRDWWRIFYPHHSLYAGTFRSWFVQSRFVLWTRFMARLAYFLVRRRGRIDEWQVTPGTEHNRHVIQHNFRDNLRIGQFSRGRLEKLLYPLLSVPVLKKTAPLLSIGPKNEGEILLLEAHGFRSVVGIDLFTYSPKIQLMDMHAMTFGDNTFDTVFSDATLTYAYDVKKVVGEIIRVSKDGALVCISFGLFPPQERLSFATTQLDGGVRQLLSFFGSAVGHVYWWNEGVIPGRESRICSVIFQLQKSGSRAERGVTEDVAPRSVPSAFAKTGTTDPYVNM